MKILTRISYALALLSIIAGAILSYYLYRMPAQPDVPPLPPVVEPLPPMAKIDSIVVEKAKRTMTVYHQEKALRTYRVALGFDPIGHKEQEGDGKTPEGHYTIVGKNPKSLFRLSLKISYPSTQDKKNAKAKGVNPGGDIMIHGLGDNFGWIGAKHTLRDWTLGCVAITNEEIEELYPFVDVGTVVQVKS
jgi:murein L,D-transpeptidase YafK